VPRTPLIDYHIHSTFSEDGLSPPEECARQAVLRGLTGIIFTEHLEFPPPPDYPEPAYYPARTLEARTYEEAVRSLRSAWAGTLDIGLGVELGLESHNLDAWGSCTEKDGLELDFVLGSLHSVEGRLVQLPEYTSSLGAEEAARRYFTRLLEGVRRAAALGACDVVGHLDLVKRSPAFGPFHLEAYRPLVEEVLRSVVERGLGLEVNTSGLRQCPGEPYPGLKTLRLYRRLGGEIVTVGSDSHTARTVGAGAAEALDLIRAAGFRYLSVFSGRHPRFVRI